MKRMADRELKLMADSQPLGPSWIRDVLHELLEHRARIAAHAAAHPERLSDEELAGDASAFPTIAQAGSMALEIWQRRAADLTPKEIAFAKEWLRDLEDFAHMEAPEAQIPISIFRKLLAAHGVTP